MMPGPTKPARGGIKEIRVNAVITRGPSGMFGPPGHVEDLGEIVRTKRTAPVPHVPLKENK